MTTQPTQTNAIDERAEYAVVGAGPAGICAIANLIREGVSAEQILWIDPAFHVGDFGGVLSIGSSVPGNTNVESYQLVNRTIYDTIPACASLSAIDFPLNHLPENDVCALKIAAQPLQAITGRLKNIVRSITGSVSNISTTPLGFQLDIQLSDGEKISHYAKRVILAIGATAKTMPLPHTKNPVVIIPPNTAFVESELNDYLNQHPNIKTVAVIGSSHSAALAAMHLLKSGVQVKQFMNKNYLYATPCVTPDGVSYTRYDNTGLKGTVAKFTKKLQSGNSEFSQHITYYQGHDRAAVQALLATQLEDCQAAVIAIGYTASPSLQINGRALSDYSYDPKTTEFKNVPGLFGIGVAFPPQVQAPSGEIEFAVGVGKFWKTTSDASLLSLWRNTA